MIDATLTWHNQITCLKVYLDQLGCYIKSVLFANIKIMKTLYYRLVYHHLLYAIEVWGLAGITLLSRLLVLQKRIVNGC